MSETLRVLIAEDNPTDVALILRALSQAGYAVEHRLVDSAAAMRSALEESAWELVLSDFNMPSFGAREALALVKATGRKTPFILVSGAVGEEAAVELMKAGADDYILKTNLAKLGPAIARCLRQSAGEAREKAAHAEAEKAVADRERMLAVVSHDLKNPLNAIQLNIKLMERTLGIAPGPDKEKLMRNQIGRMQRSIDRMSHLITDVLDLAKIEAGRFVVEKSDNQAEELVSDVLDLFEPLAMQKSITLRSELPKEPLLGYFDREKLFQAIANLVGNSLKFTSERGTVTLLATKSGQDTHFMVSDTGPGISPEHLPNIFNRFWQAHETARMGTGLGLSIAKGIVEAHGGKIWAESELNRGAVFSILIPSREA